jgi:hexosaminidase
MKSTHADPSPKPAIRALHLDLKGLPPTTGRLPKLLEIAKAAGYTAVMVEWEDQFPWSEPRFRSETCYSRQEVAAFHAKAVALGLEVIPLVQCIGHMETFLRIPENTSLREVEQHPDVLNPLAPGAMELVQGLVDQVLALTPSLRHFHLGGDEAWTFGTHPDTKAFVETHGKGALYLRHLEPLLDQLLARGIRPILWHDMMVEWDEAALRSLGAKADLCVWAYGRYDRKNQPWLHPLSERDRSSDLPVLAGGGGPVGEALFERFSAAGVPLWGAGAYKCGQGTIPHNPDLPSGEERLRNALDWARYAERFPLRGLVATAWSRATTDAPQYQPIDATLDLLVATALAWNGETDDLPAKAHALLASLGEAARFDRCRDLMERLTNQRKMAWINAICLRETLASMDADPRRRSITMPGKLHGYLANHIQAIEAIEREAMTAFVDATPPIWLQRYFQERLDPLRQEHADLQDRLTRSQRA